MSVLTIVFKLLVHTRRDYPHPQDRLVWRIRKVGVPILLKLRAELGHLGGCGAPLDPRVDRAKQVEINSEGDHSQGLAHLCVEICFLVLPNSAAAATVSGQSQSTHGYTSPMRVK